MKWPSTVFCADGKIRIFSPYVILHLIYYAMTPVAANVSKKGLSESSADGKRLEMKERERESQTEKKNVKYT